MRSRPEKMTPKRYRTIQQLKKSRFTEMLIDENCLGQDRFESWIFCRGMLFNSADKWWGDHGLRDYPHEGIDLCLYEDQSGKIRRLSDKTRIPVIEDGVVRAVIKDYLGKSVLVEHKYTADHTGRALSFYAHTHPLSAIKVGAVVEAGDVIATLADTSLSKSNIIPHLHLSIGLPSDAFSYDRFVWNTIRQPGMITLLDPLAVIDWPHRMLDDVNSSPVDRKL